VRFEFDGAIVVGFLGVCHRVFGCDLALRRRKPRLASPR
jgi:hypothetical protein